MADLAGLAYPGRVSGYRFSSRARARSWFGVCALGAALTLAPAAKAAYPTGFEVRPMIEGLSQPVAVDWAAGGRAFVAEKPGVLKTVAPGGAAATTVLDWRNKINDHGDRGLEDVAVDSSFATNGYLYLAYVKELQPLTPDSDAPMVSQLVRIEVDPATGQLADPNVLPKVVLGSQASQRCPAPSNTLDCMPADSSTHMIGTVKSDADGTLWVGHGDGAGFSNVDPQAFRSLDPVSLAGKVLHVDRDGKGLPGHAFCSADTDLSHACTKVHAKGFRNPFRFQLGPAGKLLLGDVGWNTREEVNVVDAKGKSYGWPCYEGTIRTPGYEDRPECAPIYAAAAETGPIHDYPHCPDNPPPTLECGNASLGGPEYTGDSYPAGYRGSFFTGDYVSGKLLRFEPAPGGGYKPPVEFSDSWYGVDLEPAPDNDDLAYVDFGSGAGPDGSVNRIAYSTGNRTPVAGGSATPPSGSAPLSVAFTSSGSSDPDGDTLSYDWDFGDNSSHATTATANHTYTAVGSYTATLTVSDGRGRSATKRFTITAGDTAPLARIESPTAGSLYRDGGTVRLLGSATDAEQGELPDSALDWTVILHHGTHTHPLTSFQGRADADFTTQTDHDADSYYEIVLTVTDAQGLTDTDRLEIRPETTTARIESTPTGAPVSYGGRTGTAPFTQTTAVGYRTSVTAQSSFTSGGRPFLFDSWSDGQPGNVRSVDVPPPPGLSLRALYLEDKAQGLPASASSTEAGYLAAAEANDGDSGTRWGSSFQDGQHWQVDLGRRRTVNRVRLNWEGSYASRYQILTSNDGATWSQAAEQTLSAPETTTTTFSPRVARYVRVLGVTRATEYGISFWDAQVLGPIDDTAPPQTTITSAPDPTGSGSASFTFASEADATFECRLDSQAWAACTSPAAYDGLMPGTHTFSVRASDQSGNVEASPPERTFRVTAPSSPPPDPAPPAAGGGPSPPAPQAPPKTTPTPVPKRAGYATVIAASKGLRAFFGLGDDSSSARNAAATGNGRYRGAPRRVRALLATGRDRYARAFDGKDDHLTVQTRRLGRTRAITAEMWLRPARTPKPRRQALLSTASPRRGPGLTLGLDTGGRVIMRLTRTDGSWKEIHSRTLGARLRHVIAAYDGRRMTIYIDGRVAAGAAFARGVPWHGGQMVVGADQHLDRRFAGTLDELSLYDRALSSAAARAHFASGR